MVLFYRFQNTLDIEKESYYVDINLAFEDFEAYESYFNTREELYEELLDKYNGSFELRKGITPEELLSLIEKAYDNGDTNVDELVDKYKVPYIFGYRKEEMDEEYKVIEILDDFTRPGYWHCESDKYLIVYEGIEVLDEYTSGILFKPTKLVGYYITKELNDSNFYILNKKNENY